MKIFLYFLIFLIGLIMGNLIFRSTSSIVNIELDNPKAIFADINEFRKSKSLNPLMWAENLCPFTEIRLKEVQNDFSHIGFELRKSTMFQDYCPFCNGFGENLAKGFNDEQDVVNAWINSPKHLPQLLSPWIYTCVKVQNSYTVITVSY